jgi:hypothetical protein
MSPAATPRTVGDQITTLLAGFTLTTAAREMVSRFVQAQQQPALSRCYRPLGSHVARFYFRFHSFCRIVSRNSSSVTFRYRCVVLRSACPSKS